MDKEKTRPQILTDIVLNAAIDAGSFLRENAFKQEYVEWKKKDDPVTDLDRKTENMIIEHFKSNANFNPKEFNIIGEEYGIKDVGGKINIYIDPIDGTKSFLKREFNSSISIAAAFKGCDVLTGAVYDFMKDLLYITGIFEDMNKRQTFLYRTLTNEKYELPLKIPNLSKKTIIIDKESKYENLFSKKAEYATRTQFGSIALSMAQLAAGTTDGLIISTTKTNTWDVAAGYNLMSRAGIKIYDYDYHSFNYENPNNGIIAIKPDIADKVLKIIKGEKNA